MSFVKFGYPVHHDMIMRSVLTIFVFWVLSASTQVLAAEAGIIKTVKGLVQVERADGVIEAKVGDMVYGGDRVRVRGDGSAGISLKDETLLSVGPNSSMIIVNFTYNPTTREGQVETSILKGTLRFVTGLIGRLNPNAIKVTTPQATIGIRGTDFIVEVPDDE